MRGLISFIENEKKNVQISQDEYVDIICFVENEDEFDTIFNEINSQDYKKINIFVLTKQNEFLIKQRDLLLPRLMSGKLAV